jgi:restriction endonuclease S subunit
MREAWTETTLGQVAEVVMGRQLSPNKKLGLRPKPYLRAANIGSWGISLDEVFEMDFTETEEEQFSCRVGDVLLVEGGNEKSVGCPALVSNREAGLCIQNTIIRCRIQDKSSLTPEFLFQLLRHNFWMGKFGELCAGTTIMHLGQKRAAVFPVVLPPVKDQKRIVDLVSAVDEYIAALQRQAEAARTARNAVLHELLDAGCNVWPETTLDDLVVSGVVTIGRGHVISKSDMKADPGPYPVYSSAQNNDGMIGSYNKYMFDEELITWSVDGGGHVFYRQHHKFSVTNIGGYLRIIDSQTFLYPFLAAVLQRLHSQQSFDWQNKAHPSVIRKLYKNIPLAPIENQRRIVEIVSSVDDLIHATETAINESKALRSGLLSDLLSGEHEIPASYDRLLGAA